MNYPPNTHHWRIGDKVLHDCDAKKEYMLMEVVGYRKDDGRCITHYLEPNHFSNMRGLFYNEIKYLHDPKQFGVATEEK